MVYWARATKTSLQKEGGFIMHFHNVFFLIFFCKKYCRKPYLLLKRKSFVLTIFFAKDCGSSIADLIDVVTV